MVIYVPGTRYTNDYHIIYFSIRKENLQGKFDLMLYIMQNFLVIKLNYNISAHVTGILKFSSFTNMFYFCLTKKASSITKLGGATSLKFSLLFCSYIRHGIFIFRMLNVHMSKNLKLLRILYLI